MKAWRLGMVLLLWASEAQATLLSGGVLGNGGTPATGISGGGRVMLGTAGQAAVGVSSNATRILCHGFWCFGGVRVVAVDDGTPGTTLPKELAFGPARPNPARGAVHFTLALPQAAEVDLSLYDVSGRRVGALVSSRLEAGVSEVHWDGTDASGRAAGAGFYFARLMVDGRLVAKRPLVMIR